MHHKVHSYLNRLGSFPQDTQYTYANILKSKKENLESQAVLDLGAVGERNSIFTYFTTWLVTSTLQRTPSRLPTGAQHTQDPTYLSPPGPRCPE